MGRRKNPFRTKKVEPRLDPKAYACLEKLVELGGYGSNPTEVAKYLIHRELDDLRRGHVLPTD